MLKVLRNLVVVALALFANVSFAAEQADFRMCFHRSDAQESKQPTGCYDYRLSSDGVERVYDAFRLNGARASFQVVYDRDGNMVRSQGGTPSTRGEPAFIRVFAGAKVGDSKTLRFDRITPSGEKFSVRTDIRAVEAKTMKFGATELQVIVFESTEWVGQRSWKMTTMYCPEIRMQCGSESPYHGGFGNGFTMVSVNPALLGALPAREQVAEAR